MTENQPARLPAGAAGAPCASRTGNAVARRGDLLVVHLRHRDWKDGRPRKNEFWFGQVTSAGMVRLCRPAASPGRPAGAAGRGRRQRLPSLWSRNAVIKRHEQAGGQGALATAACHVWPGHENHARDGSLQEFRAALRPHLLDRAGWERLRGAVPQPARNTAHRQPLASSARQPRPSSCRAACRTGSGPECS